MYFSVNECYVYIYRNNVIEKSIDYCYQCKHYYCNDCWDDDITMCKQCSLQYASENVKEHTSKNKETHIKCFFCETNINNVNNQCKECDQNFCPNCWCDCNMVFDWWSISAIKYYDTGTIEIFNILKNIKTYIKLTDFILVTIAMYAIGKTMKCINYNNCQQYIVCDENSMREEYTVYEINGKHEKIKYMYCIDCTQSLINCEYEFCYEKCLPILMKKTITGQQLCIEHNCLHDSQSCSNILMWDKLYHKFLCINCNISTKCTYPNCKHRITTFHEKLLNNNVIRFCNVNNTTVSNNVKCRQCFKCINSPLQCGKCHVNTYCFQCNNIYCSECIKYGLFCGSTKNIHDGCGKYLCKQHSHVKWLSCIKCEENFCSKSCLDTHRHYPFL